jgi:osmoprotectant transport system substrate-binding protein
VRSMRTRVSVSVAAVLVSALVVAGCGGGGGEGSGELSGTEFIVGSKEFTEQLILGEMTRVILEDAGASVEDQIGMAGTDATRQALVSGEMDMYWEYTGTGWINYLGNTDPIPDRQEQFEAVAEADLEENSIKWLAPPAPANNTFAIVVRSEAQEDLGVENLSDMGDLISERPEAATFCTDSEFASRDDALPGLEETYGYEFPDENIQTVAIGVIPSAVDEGDLCNFGVMQSTDGRIAALDLAVLEDDEGFFPLYNPALTMRQETFEENEQLEDLFVPLSEKLTTETLQTLNAAVDVDGEDPADVAEEWLREEGFIE